MQVHTGEYLNEFEVLDDYVMDRSVQCADLTSIIVSGQHRTDILDIWIDNSASRATFCKRLEHLGIQWHA